MTNITLHIPPMPREAPCCRRSRTISRWTSRLNMTNFAIAVAEVIAFFLWHKTLPSWFSLIRWPALFLIFSGLFFPHWLALRLPFIPETPDPQEETPWPNVDEKSTKPN